MTLIPLHKERGLDPHLTFCPRCGGEGAAVTVGAMRKAQLETGQWAYANVGQTEEMGRKLEKAGAMGSRHSLLWVELGEREKVPDSDPCPKCQEDLKQQREEVEKGGVYFRCSICGASGVIRAEVPYAEAVRIAYGKTNGEPCGVEFDECSQHTVKE